MWIEARPPISILAHNLAMHAINHSLFLILYMLTKINPRGGLVSFSLTLYQQCQKEAHSLSPL